MSDDALDPTDLTYYGGPRDGEIVGETVVLQPGWPPPGRLRHPDWPGGSYVLNRPGNRYEWSQEA